MNVGKKNTTSMRGCVVPDQREGETGRKSGRKMGGKRRMTEGSQGDRQEG